MLLKLLTSYNAWVVLKAILSPRPQSQERWGALAAREPAMTTLHAAIKTFWAVVEKYKTLAIDYEAFLRSKPTWWHRERLADWRADEARMRLALHSTYREVLAQLAQVEASGSRYAWRAAADVARSAKEWRS